MIKTLKITNNRGDVFEFGRYFRLVTDLNTSGLTATVNTSESNNDGSVYQNTKLDNRDFEIEFHLDKIVQDDVWLDEQRMKLFRVLNPKFNQMRIDFTTTSGREYYLKANLLSSPTLPIGNKNNNVAWQKGLLQFMANDPYIYEKNETVVEIATWIGGFEFPLEIVEEGIEMGTRSQSLIANVYNGGGDVTGMIILFKANATVVNPSLINVNTYEEFKLDITLQGGDVVEVSTYKGRKTVVLIRNNVRSDLLSVITINSTFLSLDPGDNLFRYNTDSGIDNLEVSMRFINRFVGV